MKLFLSITLLLFNLVAFGQAENDSVKYKNFPTNKVFKMDSTRGSFNKILSTSRANVIMFFSPDCDHCEDEINSLTQNINLLDSIQFTLVSNRPLFMLKPFIKKMGLNKYKNFKVISDSNNEIARYYGIGSYPSLVIYNRQQQFKKKILSSIVPPSIIKNIALGE